MSVDVDRTLAHFISQYCVFFHFDKHIACVKRYAFIPVVLVFVIFGVFQTADIYISEAVGKGYPLRFLKDLEGFDRSYRFHPVHNDYSLDFLHS